MRTILHVTQDVVLLATRITLGITLSTHGWHRWTSGVGKQIAHLEAAAIPHSSLVVWATIVIELIGGILMAFGLATRLIGLIIVTQNALIIIWLRWPNGLFIEDNGFELNLMLAALGLLFAAFGAGRVSIDRLFHVPKRPQLPARGIIDDPVQA